MGHPLSGEKSEIQEGIRDIQPRHYTLIVLNLATVSTRTVLSVRNAIDNSIKGFTLWIKASPK